MASLCHDQEDEDQGATAPAVDSWMVVPEAISKELEAVATPAGSENTWSLLPPEWRGLTPEWWAGPATYFVWLVQNKNAPAQND